MIWDHIAHLARISFETGEAARIGKFALVGLSGALVNLFAYRWLVGGLHFSVWAAAALAASAAIVNNFVWNERFTFPESHAASPGWGSVLQRFGMFALISGVGLLLSVAVVELCIALLHFPWLPGVSAGIIIAGAWNFFTNANLTWSPGRRDNALATSEAAEIRPPNQPAAKKMTRDSGILVK